MRSDLTPPGDRVAPMGGAHDITLGYAIPHSKPIALISATARCCCGVLGLFSALSVVGVILDSSRAGQTTDETLGQRWSDAVQSNGVAGTAVMVAAVVLPWLAIIPLLMTALFASRRRVQNSRGVRLAILSAGLLLMAASAAADFGELVTQLAGGNRGQSWLELSLMAMPWPADAAYGALLAISALAYDAAQSAVARRALAIVLLTSAIAFVPPVSYVRLAMTMYMLVFGDNGPSGWSEVAIYASAYGGVVVAALLVAAAVTLWWRTRWQRPLVIAACAGVAWQPALVVGLWVRESIATLAGRGEMSLASCGEVLTGVGQWSIPLQTVAFCLCVGVWTSRRNVASD